jgi:hypothetical protein
MQIYLIISKLQIHIFLCNYLFFLTAEHFRARIKVGKEEKLAIPWTGKPEDQATGLGSRVRMW